MPHQRLGPPPESPEQARQDAYRQEETRAARHPVIGVRIRRIAAMRAELEKFGVEYRGPMVRQERKSGSQ
jgi:hypothetical protein